MVHSSFLCAVPWLPWLQPKHTSNKALGHLVLFPAPGHRLTQYDYHDWQADSRILLSFFSINTIAMKSCLIHTASASPSRHTLSHTTQTSLHSTVA